jgi:rhomboid domain-containing protein 1
MRRNVNARGNFALMMLVMEFSRIGLENIPPVTLVLAALQIVVHYFDVHLFVRFFPYAISQACIGAGAVWYQWQFKRLIFHALFHRDDWHLSYNIGSFLWKGRALEPQLGPAKFMWSVLLFAVMGGMIHTALALIAAHVFDDESLLRECAVGFSGVIFSLKVVLNYSPGVAPITTPNILGFPLPFSVETRHVCWVELLVIWALMPSSSIWAHVSGILAGLVYVSGVLEPLFSLPDKVMPMFDGAHFGQDGRERPRPEGRGRVRNGVLMRD